jgi:hypothetical protein
MQDLVSWQSCDALSGHKMQENFIERFSGKMFIYDLGNIVSPVRCEAVMAVNIQLVQYDAV